jgi:FAD/FMN-containing dehydrogenase
VKYAAKRGIKLLVKNTSHGFTKSVRSVVNGIQISVRQMNSINLDLEKNVATLGGGVIMAEFVDALWKAGKRTGLIYNTTGGARLTEIATGNCDCVGLMGAGLGGGHGRHQGLYGLVSDNILSASLVTASGALISVSSTHHPELYWALRGAGHNFGVVVEVKLKIYDKQEADMWANADYIYEDKDLETVFAFLEKYRDVQPKEMTLFVSFTKNIDEPTGPGRVRVSVQYGGLTDFETVGAPFLELGPVITSNSSVAYPQVATATGIGLNMGLCLHGSTRRAHFSTQVKNFKIPAIRDAKTFYDETMLNYPQFDASSMVWEMYPLQAFKAVSSESTAYPHRDFNMIS